ncbi:cytochrome B [uncultured Jannaschia sp.]|uniref:cytochrome B n=1 Tax=uncultured Jannaschia sp. TaxID=293347 RepID=UPI002636972A|nr:cytochrome B [uncultured Jannaschia sp.]
MSDTSGLPALRPAPRRPAIPRPRVDAVRRLLPARRTYLKALHGAMIPLTGWFMIATPDFVRGLFGPKGAAINSDIALVFVALALLWSGDYFARGLAGRPGPKLPSHLRTFHRRLHKTLVWLLFLVPVGGFLLGLTSERLLLAGGWLPIAPPLGLARANDVMGLLHRVEFYALGALVVLHAAFHVWRHVRLRDNALRIMAPKVLHRFL